MRRVFATFACFFLLGSATFAGEDALDPSSSNAFHKWVNVKSDRLDHYQAFEAFLRKRGVNNVVPAWQLWRIDGQYAKRCGTDFFAVPPRKHWPSIVPALLLIRDEVVPVVGTVDVVSASRTPEINACVNGASRSKHLQFRALDLVTERQQDRTKLFTSLCKLQRRVGARTKMGLGAYFDPDDKPRNTAGRFHIDAEGSRTWGFDYTRKSSPCAKLLRQVS
ncbi:D-Ala-D-Ala carboxypeptidase family metallohydrolase [Erythrobacter sp. F6033]|uniref:D-Ala-D-Ala carboxypeptidase family metallohydrolase n=1 Tax=Erythrobacter sp. F6033 TaxID=2926401 RepID=UPI001FF37BC6|nr:D-Ala-D-Ala carboxypeptidase family metallohydrolase [Erythrobacter sp. F6033]MCK0127840.1 D-Ala-D-Ala carboxypeptidase family metallohydrolase [Erythrobacter sp. F6033]